MYPLVKNNRLYECENFREVATHFDIEVSEASTAAAATSDYFDKYNNLPEDLTEKTGEIIDIDALAKAVADKLAAAAQAIEKTPGDTEKQKAEILEGLDFI